jgi:hypothetical protein
MASDSLSASSETSMPSRCRNSART